MNIQLDTLSHSDATRLSEAYPKIEAKIAVLKSRAEAHKSLLLAASAVPQVTLESIRRDALKANLELEGLGEHYNNTIGIDFVASSIREELREVGAVRKAISLQFVEADNLLSQVKQVLKTMRGKVQEKALAELEEMEVELKVVLRELHAVLFETPELGMTFAEWDSLSVNERRSMRSPGRPTAPIEAQIIKMKRHLLDCVATANRLSNGEIRTVEEALKDTELTKRGRPQISDLGKLDRKLQNLLKRLEEVCSTPSKMQGIKKARLISQIEDIRNEIADRESEMTDLEIAKRKLESLRSAHRDMVVAEVPLTGEDQAAMLMAIIRNEDEQLSAIETIMKMDPEARITVTHKVNPRETRFRFERLRTNGQLKTAEYEELSRLEQRQESFGFTRNR